MTTAADLLSDRNSYQLAKLAECASPDAPESPGGLFLSSVFNDVRERLDYSLTDEPDVSVIVRSWDDDGTINEIADNAPDVYTYTRWQEFTDLAAWDEYVSEFGDVGSLTQTAGVALYMIAERLVRALLDEIADNVDD